VLWISSRRKNSPAAVAGDVAAFFQTYADFVGWQIVRRSARRIADSEVTLKRHQRDKLHPRRSHRTYAGYGLAGRAQIEELGTAGRRIKLHLSE